MDTSTRTPVTDFETGPAAAVVVAAGIGALVLGIFTTLAEASTGMKDWLQWNDRVGPLSGKTILAVIAFFASWAVLHFLWRTAQLAKNAITARIVLPESGPTRSFHCSQSFMPVLASASVVKIPSTSAPIPAATTTAAAGPRSEEHTSEL